MKNFILGLFVMGTLSTQASMLEINGPLDDAFYEAEITQDKSYYDTLGDLFSQGILPDLAKITNIAWSGRCFHKDKPNEPTNAGYIIRQKRTSDVGPLGQSVKPYEALSYWYTEKAPNFFDTMSIEQVYAVILAYPMDAIISANQISIKINRCTMSNLKISGTYLVEELVGSISDAGPLATGVTFGRCYYFIPELNN